MKNFTIKWLLSLFLITSMAFISNAQTLIQSADWPNTEWTVTGTYNSSAFISDPTLTSNFSYNDDAAGSSSPSDIINAESPVIDLTTYHGLGETLLTVDYEYNNNLSYIFNLEYYDADADTWVVWEAILDNSSTTSSWCASITEPVVVSSELSILDFTATQLSGFKYRIAYDASSGWGWGFCFNSPIIKSVTPPTCLPPTELAAAEITPWEATLSWLLPGDVDNWYVEYGEVGFDLGTANNVSLTNNWTTVEELTPSTDYEFYVKAVCTVDDSSTWSGPFPFSTIAACPQPTELGVLDITSNEATLVWTTGGAEDFNLIWGPSGFNMEDSTVILLTDTFLILSDLESSTDYEFYVKDSCAEGNVSLWSGPHSFTTLCGIEYPDYLEEFEVYSWSVLPNCWEEKKGEIANPTEFTSTSSNWTGGTFANSGSNCAELNLYSTNRFEWLVSPSIDLGEDNNMQLEFDVSFTDYANSNPPESVGEDDKFAVVISIDDGETWNLANALRVWEGPGSPYLLSSISHTGDHVILDLSGYTGIVKFGLYGETTLSNSDNDLHVDNFRVRIAPTCNEPTALSASNITGFQAELAWLEQGTATSWNIELVGYGETPTGIATQTGVSNSYIYEDLTPETTYEFYVQSDCGEEDLSLWSGPHSFTTDVSCPAPMNLMVEEYTATTALFSWESGGSSNWNVQYGEFGFTLGDGTIVEITETSYEVTDFTEETTYHFYVQDSCGEGDVSYWVGPISVTTTSSCPEPIELTAAVMDVSATISWNGLFATNWDVEWGEVGFEATGIPTNEDIADDFLLIEDIILETSYDFYVRADCGENNEDTSIWAGPYTFTTVPQGSVCSFPLPLTLPADSVSGTTNGYGNEYNQNMLSCTNYALDGNDIVYEFTIEETSYLTGNAYATPNNTIGFFILDGCPDDPDATCVYSGSNWGPLFIENEQILPGTYYLIVSTSSWTSNIDFEFSLVANPPLTETDFLEFAFNEQSSPAIIDTVNHTIDIVIAYSADITNIYPIFTLSLDATTAQTHTDFTDPVVYTVVAQDGVTSQDWTVTVTITPPNTENDFISYSIPEQTTTPVAIDDVNHTVDIEVGNGTDPLGLVASFEISTFATINVDGVNQLSGVTPNDFVFDTPFEYNVVAEDETVQIWNVTVTEADIFTETDIVSFVLDQQTDDAIIDSENHTVTINVNWESDITNLYPEIAYSYGATSEQDNTNDFTDPVTYTVIAEDGVTEQDWEVTVILEPAPEGALCSTAIELILPAENVTGTTEGFGDNYDQNDIDCINYYLNGDDIVYEFTIDETGYLSGDLTTTNSWVGMFVLDACPDDTSASCIVNETSSGQTLSFENQYIEPGTYLYIISSWPSPQSVDFDFNLNFVPESEVEFIEFDIPGSLTNFLSQELDSVHILMPMGTDLDSLVAEYVASEGAYISVGFTEQESGITVNNWADDGIVYYNILGEDGITFNEYIVVVEKVLNDQNEILEYEIFNEFSHEILEETQTINVIMPEGTENLSGLIATFSLSEGATAYVDGIEQTSEVTINNWTEGSVIYTITAENGDEQIWTVNVTVNPYTGNEILEYSIPGEFNKTFSNDSIYIMMNEAITDISSRIAEFTLSDGATAYVNGVEQESAETENNFSLGPIPYTIIAENSDTKTWIVIVDLFEGLNEIEESSEINVYPNPNNGLFNVKLDILTESNIELEILNAQGQVVSIFNNVNTSVEQEIDLSKLATGIYYLKIQGEKEVYIKKINILK